MPLARDEQLGCRSPSESQPRSDGTGDTFGLRNSSWPWPVAYRRGPTAGTLCVRPAVAPVASLRKVPSLMPIAEPHSGLISAAHRYMRDAANTQLSPHGRYGAAMNALRVLCLAGVGDEHDQILVDLWEASRYDVDAWPSRYQVAVVMMHIAKLMHSSSVATFRRSL